MRVSALLLTASVLLSPCFVQVVRAESTIAGAEQSQDVRVIETEGQGRTTVEARKAAVAAAIEQAVGVYIDSRRRSEMQLSDERLHELVEEKIQTYSSAFVEKVETLSSKPDGQGGSIVRLRSYVVVPELLNALKDADIPFASVDTASNQTKFETLEEKEQGAAEIFVTQFEELPKKIRIEVVPGSIKGSLSQVDRGMAILRGQLSVTFNTSGLKQVFDAFRTYTDVESPSGTSNFVPPTPRKVFVCISNLLGQVTACHGEMDPGRTAKYSRPMYIKAILRSGKEELGTIRGLVNFKCMDFKPRFRWQPSYFEASSYYDPYSLEFQRSAEWGYFDDAARSEYPGADFESSSVDELGWARSRRDPRRLSLRITSVPVDAGTTQDTRVAELHARAPARSICSFSDQHQGLRLLVSDGSAPLTRYFYIVGPKEVIAQVDQIGFSVETE